MRCPSQSDTPSPRHSGGDPFTYPSSRPICPWTIHDDPRVCHRDEGEGLLVLWSPDTTPVPRAKDGVYPGQVFSRSLREERGETRSQTVSPLLRRLF